MNKTFEKLRAKSPVTIVAVGDSNNVICGHTKGRFNWFHHLHLGLCETFGDGFIYMINSAVCGNTVTKQLTRMEQDILRFKPDLVIASFGINDQGMGLGRIDEFRENYRAFIHQVQGVGAELLLRTPYRGDTGMVFVSGRMVHDNFQAGNPWEIGLRQFLPEAAVEGVVLRVVPKPVEGGSCTQDAMGAGAINGGDFKDIGFDHIEAIPEYRLRVRFSA